MTLVQLKAVCWIEKWVVRLVGQSVGEMVDMMVALTTVHWVVLLVVRWVALSVCEMVEMMAELFAGDMVEMVSLLVG